MATIKDTLPLNNIRLPQGLQHPELAEAILLELSMRDVLITIQRTSLAWHDNLDAAVPLQQALFFKPITARRLNYYYSPDRSGELRRRWTETDDAVYEPEIVEHPLLSDTKFCTFHRFMIDDEPFFRSEISWRRQFSRNQPLPAWRHSTACRRPESPWE
ncbi:hypothetical protein LTR08_007530 [Meristemomyces frigidus]|nr:hypothetical protein LTR08_007530 [Meristemomyces frigidus]